MNEVLNLTNAIIELLKTQNKLHLLPELADELKKEAEIQQHEVVIESAIELSDRELDHFANILTKKLGYQPAIVNRIDPELIAGIKLRIGDQVLDVTVKNRLDQIRNTVH